MRKAAHARGFVKGAAAADVEGYVRDNRHGAETTGHAFYQNGIIMVARVRRIDDKKRDTCKIAPHVGIDFCPGYLACFLCRAFVMARLQTVIAGDHFINAVARFGVPFIFTNADGRVMGVKLDGNLAIIGDPRVNQFRQFTVRFEPRLDPLIKRYKTFAAASLNRPLR